MVCERQIDVEIATRYALGNAVVLCLPSSLASHTLCYLPQLSSSDREEAWVHDNKERAVALPRCRQPWEEDTPPHAHGRHRALTHKVAPFSTLDPTCTLKPF